MAWSFVGVSSVVEVSVVSHPLVTTGITGLQEGDLLIACIASRIASTASITASGWTVVAEQKTNNVLATTSGIASALMAYRIRTAVAGPLTFTHPVAPSVALGRIVAYRGHHNTVGLTLVDAQTAFTTAAIVTAVSGAGLTTTQADDLIVAMVAGGQEAAWSAFNATTPSGASGATSTAAPTTAWLERADSLTTGGADTSLAIFDALKTTAGATGNLTATASVAGGNAVIAGAFKIAPASTADGWNVSDKSPELGLSGSDKIATVIS
jgi:hypothetical protein